MKYMVNGNKNTKMIVIELKKKINKIKNCNIKIWNDYINLI